MTTMDAELKQLTQLNVSENQIKVIRDKYLKDSPTIEHWIRTICHNIALSDIIHSERTNEDEIFAGVNNKKITYKSKGKNSQYFLLHHGLKTNNEMRDNFRRFVQNLEQINQKNPGIISATEEKFYDLLSNFKFLPNSPTLMNAGRDLQQLSACYVLPVGDSIDEIYTSVKNMALIHKSGGGTGFSFSKLRPSGDDVRTTKGVSSGPITFMQIFDKSTEVVKQGGTRRGANMGILHYTHPDILEFIDMKKTHGMMENFNVSVTIDDRFIRAVKNNEEYDLINPKDGKPVKSINAKDVWKKLVKGAWETGDPGIIMIDRINRTGSNATPHLGQIESTNPCGEQPLLPYEPCNLGSINLSKFVREDGNDFDYEQLRGCVFASTHFLDNVIDINNYPIPEIEEMAKKSRRIGLGIMGWAESLVMLGIPYNSSEALAKAEEVMKFINVSCLNVSEEIAEKRGVFPAWQGSIYDKDSMFFRGQEFFPRHSARSTIAPTGTIGIAAGLQGAGIEPFFAIVYVRYNARGLDALKKGLKPGEQDIFYEVNPLFEKIAKDNYYFGLERAELYSKINQNHKSLLGVKEIPKKIQELFLTSHDLSPRDHILIQCAFQKYTDNAVSKTVNLKNEATEKDVEDVYMIAYENGAKGVTVYRDGSKQFQVLNINETKKEAPKKKEKSAEERSDYYLIETGQGAMHIHINFDDEGPTKIFANLSPSGTDISGLATALAIAISKYLELGGDPVRILKHLNSIKSERPVGFGKNRVDSVAHGISIALRNHLIKTGKIKTFDVSSNGNSPTIIENTNPDLALHCSKCFSSNVGMTSGCSEPTCFDCGYSKCS